MSGSSGGQTQQFGQKMLMQMGWKPGEGLGKDGAGIKSYVKVHRKKDRRALGCNVADLDAAWSDAHYSSFLSRIDVGSSDEKSAAGDTSTSDSDSSDGVNHSRGLRRRRRGDLERLIREEKNGPAEGSNRADDESRSKKRHRQEKKSKKKVKEKKNKSHKKPKK